MEYMAVCHADKIHEREEAIYGTKDSGFTERCKVLYYTTAAGGISDSGAVHAG
jgi:hypothetical protein